MGITSALAEGTDAHPQLGKGMAGFGRYYWRGFVDKTDGNYLVIFALPTVFHQDERYYAMGEGGFWKRGIYAASRIFITPDYHGHNSFNISEVLGRGMAQGISIGLLPQPATALPESSRSSTDRPWGATPSPTSFASSGRTSPRTFCIATRKAETIQAIFTGSNKRNRGDIGGRLIAKRVSTHFHRLCDHASHKLLRCKLTQKRQLSCEQVTGEYSRFLLDRAELLS